MVWLLGSGIRKQTYTYKHPPPHSPPRPERYTHTDSTHRHTNTPPIDTHAHIDRHTDKQPPKRGRDRGTAKVCGSLAAPQNGAESGSKACDFSDSFWGPTPARSPLWSKAMYKTTQDPHPGKTSTKGMSSLEVGVRNFQRSREVREAATLLKKHLQNIPLTGFECRLVREHSSSMSASVSRSQAPQNTNKYHLL